MTNTCVSLSIVYILLGAVFTILSDCRNGVTPKYSDREKGVVEYIKYRFDAKTIFRSVIFRLKICS